jgi:hypothetical protein
MVQTVTVPALQALELSAVRRLAGRHLLLTVALARRLSTPEFRGKMHKYRTNPDLSKSTLMDYPINSEKIISILPPYDERQVFV